MFIREHVDLWIEKSDYALYNHFALDLFDGGDDQPHIIPSTGFSDESAP